MNYEVQVAESETSSQRVTHSPFSFLFSFFCLEDVFLIYWAGNLVMNPSPTGGPYRYRTCIALDFQVLLLNSFSKLKLFYFNKVLKSSVKNIWKDIFSQILKKIEEKNWAGTARCKKIHQTGWLWFIYSVMRGRWPLLTRWTRSFSQSANVSFFFFLGVEWQFSWSF